MLGNLIKKSIAGSPGQVWHLLSIGPDQKRGISGPRQRCDGDQAFSGAHVPECDSSEKRMQPGGQGFDAGAPRRSAFTSSRWSCVAFAQ